MFDVKKNDETIASFADLGEAIDYQFEKIYQEMNEENLQELFNVIKDYMDLFDSWNITLYNQITMVHRKLRKIYNSYIIEKQL